MPVPALAALAAARAVGRAAVGRGGAEALQQPLQLPGVHQEVRAAAAAAAPLRRHKLAERQQLVQRRVLFTGQARCSARASGGHKLAEVWQQSSFSAVSWWTRHARCSAGGQRQGAC